MHQGVVERAHVARLEPYLPGLRAELEEQREFRLEQLEEIGWAIETFEDEARLEVAYVLAMAAGSALEEIEAALERLAAGVFGTCVSCAAPVGLERLEVLPMAALCAPCQYRAEPAWSPPAAGADWVPFAAGDSDDSTRAAIISVITARLAAAESLRNQPRGAKHPT